MTSITATLLRVLPLRRRYTLVGLFICFTICLLIYSAIPSHPHALNRMVIRGAHNNQLSQHARDWLVHNLPRPLVPARRAPDKLERAHLDGRGVIPAPLKPRPSRRSGSRTVVPSVEAAAHRSRLKDGGDVYSGSLSQVVLVPYDFNVSAERLARLQFNPMLFRQLAKEVEDTRAYLASVQPDFDVNSGACRCGRSISTECGCCARLTMKKFVLERKACVNFTYVLKDQVLRVRLTYNGRVIASRTLTAARPPMLCAGRAMDLCAAFRNVSYRVQLDSPDHKTTLSGCLDLLLRLNVRPIAIYPLGCFRTGRDPKLVHIDKVNNWVP